VPDVHAAARGESLVHISQVVNVFVCSRVCVCVCVCVCVYASHCRANVVCALCRPIFEVIGMKEARLRILTKTFWPKYM